MKTCLNSQKSVNALVAVRRLSSVTSLLGMRSGPRPSMAPSLKTLQAAESEGEDMESGEESHTDKTETKENANSSVGKRSTRERNNREYVYMFPFYFCKSTSYF